MGQLLSRNDVLAKARRNIVPLLKGYTHDELDTYLSKYIYVLTVDDVDPVLLSKILFATAALGRPGSVDVKRYRLGCLAGLLGLEFRERLLL